MMQRMAYIIAVICVCLLSIGAIIVFCYESQSGWTPNKVEKVVVSACPPGTPLSAVEAWLSTPAFPPMNSDSGLFVERRDAPTFSKTPTKGRTYEVVNVVNIAYMVRDANLHTEDLGKAILVEIPNPNVGVWASGTITLVLFFDKMDRLVKHDVRVWTYSQ